MVYFFMGFKKLAGTLLLGCLGLSGCNGFKGVVLSKVHEPARIWTEERPIVVTDGYRFATGNGKIWCVDDEDWILEVGGRGRELRRFYTSQENYNNVFVGQMYRQKLGDKETENDILKKFLKPGERLNFSGDGVEVKR